MQCGLYRRALRDELAILSTVVEEVESSSDVIGLGRVGDSVVVVKVNTLREESLDGRGGDGGLVVSVLEPDLDDAVESFTGHDVVLGIGGIVVADVVGRLNKGQRGGRGEGLSNAGTLLDGAGGNASSSDDSSSRDGSNSGLHGDQDVVGDGGDFCVCREEGRRVKLKWI